MVALLTLSITGLVGYLAWATTASVFFHQVWSISLISVLLLANATTRQQQSLLESCAVWILTVLVGAFCLALSPLQLFLFKFKGAYADSRPPDVWEPNDAEDAKNPNTPPITAEYVSDGEVLHVTRVRY
jgi:hypothetical protein